MQEFPTPASVKYKTQFDEIIEIVQTKLEGRIFEFEVSEKMNEHFDLVSKHVEQYGWTAQSIVHTSYGFRNEPNVVIYWKFYAAS